jgi:hypothetical protein
MSAIPAALRETVAQRAKYRCEYCCTPRGYSPAPFEVEHIIPLVEGGSDEDANLAFACGGCNGHKAIATSGLDLETGETVPLFHPRRDSWSEHFEWQAGGTILSGLTPVGRATILRLRLNRDELVNLRRVLVAFGEMPPPEA